MNEYTKADALERINGSIIGNSVVYYDDAMQQYYVGPATDLDYLVELMNSDDEDIARDAYSHWCAGTTHSDGYETEEEATAIAGISAPTVQAPDGHFILQPDGAAWVYAHIRNGHLVAQVDEASVATHVAARDDHAWLGEIDVADLDDSDLDPAAEAAIIFLVDPDADPENIAISRVK